MNTLMETADARLSRPDLARTETLRTDLARELGKLFAARAARHEHDDTFVADNYMDLKEHRFFAALVPVELGGEGVPFAEMCDVLRILAGFCGSTALALSMHTHLVATNVWKYRHGMDVEKMLRKVAAGQPVLVSTGGRDWLESNGEVTRVENGYRVSALKPFASQSAVGEILVTSAPYHHPEEGWQVIHFSLPFTTEGLSVLNDWKAHGMRSTGSHTVKLDRVFVPDTAVSLCRARGPFHPSFNVISAVALTAVMSVYLGIAQKAASVAIDFTRRKKCLKPRGASARRPSALKPHTAAALGEMHNELTVAELAWNDMLRINGDFEFEAVHAVAQDIMTRKTLATNACIATVTKAMEIVGGPGFYRDFGLERLLRDVQAARYHPYPEKDQHQFRGDYLLRSGV